jgi:hypothetical protein
MKTIGAILTLLCAGLVVAVSAARPASTATQLDAKVGPGFSITLTQNGTKVTNLPAGDYTITVDDEATEHDFHLAGPGVDKATDIEGTGTTTWNVTVGDGSYSYFCDAHPTTMLGKFTVGAVTPPVTTPAALKVRATAKAVKRAITVRAAATRAAKYDIGLWLGTKRVAHGTKSTLHYTAKKAGRYVAKVTVKSGTSTARTTASVTVK